MRVSGGMLPTADTASSKKKALNRSIFDGILFLASLVWPCQGASEPPPNKSRGSQSSALES